MSSAEHPHLQVKAVDGVSVVHFVDSEIVYAQTLVDAIGHELTELLHSREGHKMLLNFEGVQYVCSALLAQLIQLEKKARKAGGKLRLCGLGPTLKDVFQVSHLDRLFDIDGSEAEGLSRLASERPAEEVKG